jgi:signal transduction histidine kinase
LCDALAARVAATGARLQIDPLPVVSGHASLLALLFQNLLTNALKFVPRERTPEVKVSASIADGWTTVRVQDNGIGIDPAHLGRLFQPFQRLNLKSEYEGTGLGLALARQIAEAHGGGIVAQSEPGAGASFIVTLPLAGHSAGS